MALSNREVEYLNNKISTSLYPSRDALYDFCEKHNITVDAKDELQALLDFPINYGQGVRGREDE